MGSSDIAVYVNGELSYSHGDNRCQLFLTGNNFLPFSTGFGILDGTDLIVLDRAMEYPILNTLLYFMRRRVDQDETSGFAQLLACCDDPDHASPSNPFLSKLGAEYAMDLDV